MIAVYQQDNVMSRRLVAELDNINEAMDTISSMESAYPYVEIDIPGLSFTGNIHRDDLLEMLEEVKDI